jgi:hypothetical protein
MAGFRLFSSIDDDFPNVLADPQPRHTAVAAARWLLLGLFVLCVVPRLLMAQKITDVCPDGVLYIQLAKSLERGDVQGSLHEMRLNTFPVLLLGLHRLGLPWELAGKVWGVFISSLTVLPLFGLARRQFNDRVAVVACLLYAFHARMIQWSPELIRDPTFWFLFTLSLYLLWRAVTEVRLTFFALGGIALVLSFLTRVEGIFLLLPLTLWSAWRYAALRADRRRLVQGVAVALLAFPVFFVVLNITWLHRHPHWEFSRVTPFEITQGWLQYIAGRSPNLPMVEAPLRMSARELSWEFLHTAEQGLDVVFALLMFAGIWFYRRIWLRSDHQALFYTSLMVTAGMWIHLWYAQISSNRYILPVVLMGCVFAAQALLSLSVLCGRIIRWLGWGENPQGLILAGLLLAVGTVGTSEALSCNFGYRASEPQLGKWIHARFGPAPNLLGSDGVTMVIGYYAQGDYRVFPIFASDSAVLTMTRQYQPDAVLLLVTKRMRRMKPDHYRPLLEKMKELGFEAVDPSQLPSGCERLVVLARQGNQRLASRSRGP